MNRLFLACRAFWAALTDGTTAQRVEAALRPTVEGPDLRMLALLQREGRLVDFLQEEIAGYSDAQIGAAVRDIHRGCRKVLLEYLTLEPVLSEPEEAPVSLPAGFDPAAVRLSGAVGGAGPYTGVVKHHGWKVREARLPNLPATRDQAAILAPAEVEVTA